MELRKEHNQSVLNHSKFSSNHPRQGCPIIVHSHLFWDGVWQRPQQFISRLSLAHPILFVEGPRLMEQGSASGYVVKTVPDWPNISLMQTYIPRDLFPNGRWVDARRLKWLKEALSNELQGRFEQPVQWFYDPMAAPIFIGRLGERAVVYDCMDELSQFRFAPRELAQRERFLLEAADLVFTGGRKLFESKRRFNSNCHFYGCGVDVAHFGKARQQETIIPEDALAIPTPILGYFGVVDERLDYELIARLGAVDQTWHVVLIGPTAKIDPVSLPRSARLHWLGRREYEQLPNYAKAFDVCIMPFALNEATEFINPTKALEYMATGRPIVSSAVSDVVANFGQVVHIAKNPHEFVHHCRRLIQWADQCAINCGLEMAEANTWERIVAELEKHVQNTIAKKEQVAIRRPRAAKPLAPQLLQDGLSTVSHSTAA